MPSSKLRGKTDHSSGSGSRLEVGPEKFVIALSAVFLIHPLINASVMAKEMQSRDLQECMYDLPVRQVHPCTQVMFAENSSRR